MKISKNLGSSETSRRAVVFGGIAAVSMAGLVACSDQGQSQTADAGSVVGDLPENIMGDPNAPITMIEYSSMTCPHCAYFHTATLPGLKEKYIDTGKVRYILREFPLDHLATAAFMLARCAGKDKYFPLIDAMYAKQNEWAVRSGNSQKLFDLVKQAGFTEETFKKCLNDKDLSSKIIAIKNKGANDLRVASTPTFFINGEKVEGALSLEAFDKKFAPLLGKAEAEKKK
ncbi:MAG: DsbA family protein [Methyloligellaceae bacterium]